MSDNSAPTPAANAPSTSPSKEIGKEVNGTASTTQPAANSVEPPLVSINKPAEPAATAKPADTKQPNAVSQKAK